MIEALKEKGLTPIVTLEHFTLPQWVLTPIANRNCLANAVETNPSCQGDEYFESLRGWESSTTVDECVKYVKYIVPKLKDLVDYWLTLNEPVGVYVSLGYIMGMWSPGFVNDGTRAKAALHNLIEAHVKAYDAISSIDDVASVSGGPTKMIGFANAMMDLEPATAASTDLQSRNVEAALDASYFTNDYFLNAIINGEEDLNYLDTLQRHNTSSPSFVNHPDWVNKLDFVGVNYYRRAYISYDSNMMSSSVKFLGGGFSSTSSGPHNSLLNDLGWEVYPKGLYSILMHIKNGWDKPIMITENGIADGSDKNRAQYIISHIQEMESAIKDGAEVLGYMHWSLVDNWELQEGYRSQSNFGLFHVIRNGSDPTINTGQCGNCSREITNGAMVYRYLISHTGYYQDPDKWEMAISSAKAQFGYFSPDGYALVPPSRPTKSILNSVLGK